MAYKVSGTTTSSGILHLFKDDTYLGYKNVGAGAYNAVVNTANGTGMTAFAEDVNGMVIGYGGITGISTGDAVNITELGTGPVIKSLQYNYVNIASAYSATVTISSVVVANTMLIPAGWRGTQANSLAAPYLELISSTQVRGTKGDNTSTTIAPFTAIEFEPDTINKITYGTIIIPSGTVNNTATLPQFDTSKTLLIHLGQAASANVGESYYATTLSYQSNTQIIAIKANSTSPLTVTTGYCLVEFN